MTNKTKGILAAVGSVLVIGGVGNLINSNKDDIPSVSDTVTSSNLSQSETDTKVYTIDEFCKKFDDEKDFSNKHSNEFFTITGEIENDSDVLFGNIDFESGFESTEWKTEYRVTCKFENRNDVDDLGAGDVVILKGKLFSFATSGIILQDCTLISVDKKNDNDSSTEPTTEATTEAITEAVTETTTEAATETQAPPPVTTTVAPQTQAPAPPDSTTQAQEINYVLNTSTKKIHMPYCRDVDKIDAANRSTTTDYEGAIKNGYAPCHHCM